MDALFSDRKSHGRHHGWAMETTDVILMDAPTERMKSEWTLLFR